jgi:copper resistance protein B
VLLLAVAPRAHAQGIGLEQLRRVVDWGREVYVLTEVLELAPDLDARPARYDLLAWAGGAVNRGWFKADGEHATRGESGEAELQLLYGRLITPFWDAQIGLRFDVTYGNDDRRTRTHLAVGLQGLAPGWFELEPTLLVSQHGDVSANLTASYDLLFTQRLVLQPRLETRAAIQDVPEFRVGSGFNDVELALRARYELRREFAPYVGMLWSQRFGESADLARAAGEPARELSWVAGLRLWR